MLPIAIDIASRAKQPAARHPLPTRAESLWSSIPRCAGRAVRSIRRQAHFLFGCFTLPSGRQAIEAARQGPTSQPACPKPPASEQLMFTTKADM